MIIHHAAREWGVNLRQTCVYIQRAREYMMEDFKMSRDEFALEILEGYKDLRRRSIEDKQHAVALGCLTRMAAMTQVDKSLQQKGDSAS